MLSSSLLASGNRGWIEMGLDIDALEHVEFYSSDYDMPSEDYDNFLVLSIPYEGFIDRADGLKEGIYRRIGDSYSFRAGSYSGYNRWRRLLCELWFKLPPESVWSGVVKSGPFVELINFSDCEGFIGPRTSSKLADDFATNKDAILSRSGGSVDSERFACTYNDFARAFALAAGSGAVAFY